MKRFAIRARSTLFLCATAVPMLVACNRSGKAEDPAFNEEWKKLSAQGTEAMVVGPERSGEQLLDSVRRAAAPRRAVANLPPSKLTDDAPDPTPPAGMAPSAPTENTEAPLVVPEADLRRVVRGGMQGLKQCYRLAEASVSGGSGKAILSFRIMPIGAVQDVKVQAPAFETSRLPDCVSSQVRSWQFPKFSGSPMNVTYPIVFVGG